MTYPVRYAIHSEMNAFGCTMPPEPDWDLPDLGSDAFEARVDRSGACHMWLGSFSASGYGILTIDGRQERAHRVAYERARGPIPAGLVVDHLCATKWCVNPAHLEAVTNEENLRRGGKPHFEAVAV